MDVNATKDAIKVLIDRYINLNESLYKEHNFKNFI